MTYATNLAESEQEALPELFEIVSGDTINRYTNWTQDIVFLGSTYTARHIKRSAFKVDTDLSRTTVQVAAPVTGALKEHMSIVPIEPTSITIRRALYSDLTDYVRIFTGFVMAIEIENNILTAECETLSDILSVRLPRFTYQSWCNHTVFDGGCGLDDTLYSVDGTVSAFGATNAIVQAAAWASYAEDYFTGGKIKYGNDWRWIIDHSGVTITLNAAFGPDVIVGTVLTAYPGCDGDPETCIYRFHNWDNWLGMKYIPSSNPVLWGIV